MLRELLRHWWCSWC